MSPTHLHVFRAGTHTAMDGTEIAFSTADLAATAAAYDPARHEAPIVVGHPRHDGPAYGWVRALRVEGGDLVAEVDQIEPAFADLVRAGRYRKISASFYRPGAKGSPAPGVYALKHVGFLGAAAPAVKGLRQAAFADADADDQIDIELQFGELETSAIGTIGRLLRGLRDLMIGQVGAEAVMQALPDHELEHLGATTQALRDATPPPLTPSFTEPEMPDPVTDTALAAREAALAAREAEIAAREADVAARAAEFAETARAERTATLTARIDAAVAAGKIAPAARADALAFAAEIDSGSVAFSEGAANPADWWLDQIEAAQPLIAFGEMSGPAKTAATEKTSAGISDAARKLVAAAKAEGRSLSFAAAVRQVENEMEG